MKHVLEIIAAIGFLMLMVFAKPNSDPAALTAGPTKPAQPTASKIDVSTAADEGSFNPPAVVSSEQETTKAASKAALNVAPILSDAPLQEAHFGNVSGQGPGRTGSLPSEYSVSQSFPPAHDPPPAPARVNAPMALSGRTTYGQQFSACGPNGCSPAMGGRFRLFGRRR